MPEFVKTLDVWETSDTLLLFQVPGIVVSQLFFGKCLALAADINLLKQYICSGIILINRPDPGTMPTALGNGPYRFYFYSYDCTEPRHMHVDRDNLSAKF